MTRPSKPASRERGQAPVKPHRIPPVRLGRTDPDGVAAGVFALVERGAARRPRLLADMDGNVVFRFAEGFAAARVSFGAEGVVVEDAEAGADPPDLTISGRLPDIIHLTTAPTWRGLPKLTDRQGRAAIAHVARRRVTISGERRLARSLLALLALGD